MAYTGGGRVSRWKVRLKMSTILTLTLAGTWREKRVQTNLARLTRLPERAALTETMVDALKHLVDAIEPDGP